MIAPIAGAKALPKRSIRHHAAAKVSLLSTCGSRFRCERKFYCTVQVFPSALTQVEPLMLVN
jgi:hypothetical protein